MSIKVVMVGCLATVLASTGSALAGPDWDEIGDAGSLPATAQAVVGTGPLSTIRGTLSSGGLLGQDQQDMYLIQITEPTLIFGGGFSATTDSLLGGSTKFDSALWLFDINGFGLLGTTAEFGHRGSRDGGVTLGNSSTDGTGIMITMPGFYYLAISLADSVPLGMNGTPIFSFSKLGEVSGPDGPGGVFPIADWSLGSGDGGEYLIKMSGVSFVPTPATACALLLASVFGRSRRRVG